MKFLPTKTTILFDLEYTDPDLCLRNGVYPEIWDIGAVKLTQSCEIVDEFSMTCQVNRPAYFSLECEEISNFSAKQLEFSPPFDIIYEKFKEFCGRDSVMSWGVGDFNLIVQAIGEWEFRHPYFDAISFYAGLMAGYPSQLSYGLKSACELFNLPTPKHRAVGDAICAANVLKNAMTYQG